MKLRFLAWGAALAIAAAACAQDDKPDKAKGDERKPDVKDLRVGDKAPALAVEKWVKGQPVASFEKGKVYVIEFWATWCGPCVRSMPHMTEVQKKYKEKGVTVIGLTREDPNNSLEAVEKMVKDKGDEKMGYTVAWDKGEKTSDAYMRGAGQDGIPCAFVVDQEGRVAWIGHPMNMDKPLEDIVAGKFDLAAETEAFAKQFAQGKAVAAAEADFEKIGGLVQNEKFEEAVKAIDALMVKSPPLAPQLAIGKFEMLLTKLKNYDAAYKYAREASDKYWAKDAEAFNAAAWMILDNEGVDKRDFDLALEMAKKASTLAPKSGMIADTLALAYFKKGDAAKAVETQRKAIELAKAEGSDEESIEDLKGRLKEFEQAAAKKE
ncbi:MAG: redoxin family protein [Phycisphaerae bacterium]